MDAALYINGVKIDLMEQMPVPLSYSISDIKEPENRKRNYSKTLSLPGTQNNKAFFSSTYRLSLSSLESEAVGFNYDPTQIVPAFYQENGEVIFEGLCRLMSVTINNKSYNFNITLFSNFVELFQELGNIKVAELGWSEYDHQLNTTNIVNSWATSVIKNGTPVVNFTGGVPDGFGFLYPLADYGYSSNLRDFLTNNIFPHIYTREILQKCFSIVGQTITGNFIDSEILKRHSFGFGGGDKVSISSTEVNLRKSEWGITGTFSESISYSTYSVNQLGNYFYFFSYNKRLPLSDSFWSSVTVVTDPLTQYLDSTGQWTIVKQGSYRLTFTGNLDITLPYFPSGATLRVNKNGAIIGTMILTNIDGTISFNSTFDLTANTGDLISLELSIFGSTTFTSSLDPANFPNKTFAVATNGPCSFKLESTGGVVIDGDTVYLSNYIPDIKASDYLKGIITSFNLYVSDPDTDGNVVIETMEDYYEGTDTADNYTAKIDVGKEQKILSSSQIKGKNYLFKFAEDNDFWNKYYRDRYERGYGDKNYQIPSTFEKQDRIYQLPFAQTVPVQVPGTNIVLPTIITVNDTTGAVTPFKGKGRVFLYSGLRSCNAWKLRSSSNTNSFTTYTSYPCINHLNDLSNPTFDLNFELPLELQWPSASYTNVNMFSEYHEKFIREITGKDSKILQAYFKLNSKDVKPDSFRKLANINGVIFRKNEIKDYNGNGDETTYMELVRIVEGSKRRTFNFKPRFNFSGIRLKMGPIAKNAPEVRKVSGGFTGTINTTAIRWVG